MTPIGRYLVGAGTSLLLLGSLVPAARAENSCSYDSETKTVTVVNETQAYLVIGTTSEGAITWNNLPCGEATTANTDEIVFRDESDLDVDVELKPAEGGFAPGFTDETGDSDEIEIEFEISPTDGLRYTSGERLDVRVGSDPETEHTRLNLNAGEVTGVDADLFTNTNSKRVWLRALSPKGSRLDAGGGADTGTHFVGGLRATGSKAGDTIVGGLKYDLIESRQGSDDIFTADGRDDVDGGWGHDSVNGGAGNDKRISGSLGDDEIRGGPGDDLLRGHEGDDVLFGGEGIDDLRAGGGTDACFGGGEGDQLKGCEN